MSRASSDFYPLPQISISQPLYPDSCYQSRSYSPCGRYCYCAGMNKITQNPKRYIPYSCILSRCHDTGVHSLTVVLDLHTNIHPLPPQRLSRQRQSVNRRRYFSYLPLPDNAWNKYGVQSMPSGRRHRCQILPWHWQLFPGTGPATLHVLPLPWTRIGCT